MRPTDRVGVAQPRRSSMHAIRCLLVLGSFALAVVPCEVASASPALARTTAGSPFVVTQTNVSAGAAWQINRPITIRFSDDVDFASVNSTTVSVQNHVGAPAVGEYTLIDPRTVEFQ